MGSVDFLADLGPSAQERAVAKVLSAAAAPPWPHELRGYEPARRAFENAGNVGSAGSAASAGKAGATPLRRGARVPIRLVGVKLAAVAGALTVTGVAVAAEADVLPTPIQRAAHHVLGGVGVPEPDPASRAGQTMASATPSGSGPGSGPGLKSGSAPGPGSPTGQRESPASGSSAAAPGDPSDSSGLLPGSPVGTEDSSPGPTAPPAAADALTLCRAYVAHKGKGNGGGFTAHDRRQLAILAGGAGNIDAFCTQVIAAASDSPVPQPTGASSLPTTPPSTAPSVTPDPSHDHKPNATGSGAGPSPLPQRPVSQSPLPQSTGTQGGGDGHKHAPAPSRPAR